VTFNLTQSRKDAKESIRDREASMSPSRKVALVTGSATGIGRSVAIQLARKGIAVAVNYSRSKEEAQQTLAEVQKCNVPTTLIQCNVADDKAVRAMVDRCTRELGGLDILINNAGMTHFIDHTNLEALTEEIWDEILGVNLKGAFFCCRAAIPALQQRGGGAIVNVSSVAGLQGVGSSIAYAASKAGLNSMTKSLARAFAPAIRVNAVAPGPVLTRWLAPHMDQVERHLAVTPMKRAATAEDIAEVVVFLATGTTLMTGQVVVVDGGRTM
jgi:3-oxoacyl-[acyl-carrier protein] reductase